MHRPTRATKSSLRPFSAGTASMGIHACRVTEAPLEVKRARRGGIESDLYHHLVFGFEIRARGTSKLPVLGELERHRPTPITPLPRASGDEHMALGWCAAVSGQEGWEASPARQWPAARPEEANEPGQKSS